MKRLIVIASVGMLMSSCGIFKHTEKEKSSAEIDSTVIHRKETLSGDTSKSSNYTRLLVWMPKPGVSSPVNASFMPSLLPFLSGETANLDSAMNALRKQFNQLQKQAPGAPTGYPSANNALPEDPGGAFFLYENFNQDQKGNFDKSSELDSTDLQKDFVETTSSSDPSGHWIFGLCALVLGIVLIGFFGVKSRL